jgi:hypothetical protein
MLATWLDEHAPWLWNPAPDVFIVRESRHFGPDAPVANRACTKLLAMRGVWPTTCPTPSGVPDECAAAPYCYANRSGRDYQFVVEEERG